MLSTATVIQGYVKKILEGGNLLESNDDFSPQGYHPITVKWHTASGQALTNPFQGPQFVSGFQSSPLTFPYYTIIKVVLPSHGLGLVLIQLQTLHSIFSSLSK